jgi:hypothetical protein
MRLNMNIGQAVKRLPPWGQAVVVIGVGVAGWVVYSRVRGSITRARQLRESRQTLQSVSKDLAALAKAGVRPSYPEAQYKIWADALFACYAGWGTCGDVSALLTGTDADIFVSMKNDADVLKLITAFGIRKIPSGRFNPMPDFEGSLPAVIRDENSTNYINGINRRFEKVGIKYRF